MSQPKGIDLTICLVIKCKQAEAPSLLFASDTQQSSTFLKRSVTKVRTILGKDPQKLKDPWNILVASAGDAMVIDEAFQDIHLFLRKNIDPDTETPSIDLEILRNQIGDLAYATCHKYQERGDTNCSFELLIGAADKFSTILHVNSEGKTQELERFGVIGSGQITGGELLLNEFLRTDVQQKAAANLAALVVTIVGHVDLSVGGAPDIQICRDRIAWVYKQEAFSELLTTSESKWDLIKKLWWKMLEDDTIEDKVKKIL
jgi:hypothetical protein